MFWIKMFPNNTSLLSGIFQISHHRIFSPLPIYMLRYTLKLYFSISGCPADLWVSEYNIQCHKMLLKMEWMWGHSPKGPGKVGDRGKRGLIRPETWKSFLFLLWPKFISKYSWKSQNLLLYNPVGGNNVEKFCLGTSDVSQIVNTLTHRCLLSSAYIHPSAAVIDRRETVCPSHPNSTLLYILGFLLF